MAIGISAKCYREVLGCWVAESESEASWGAVFSELKQRGLSGVSYVVSDDHAGMVKAIERHFQGAVWLSFQMKQLEDSIPAQLFVRENSGIKLTAAGDALMPYAKQLIRIRDQALEATSAINSGKALPL